MTSIIKRAFKKSINVSRTAGDIDIMQFHLSLAYFGRAEKFLLKKCIRLLKRNIKKYVNVTFVVTYNTTKLCFYTNTEEHID